MPARPDYVRKMARPDRFPLTRDECRERFSSSTLLCDAIDRWVTDGVDASLSDDVAVVMVHAVNP